MTTAPLFARYVALGDSSTEGLDDPIAPGRYRGWADRFAAHVAAARRTLAPGSAPLLYANLAVRGRKTREVLEGQLAPALAMRPDLATVFAGTNDLIRSGFALDPVVADLATMQRALRAQGATVLTITMPDLSEVMPLAARVRPRLDAFNAAVRALARETGTIVVDLAAHPFAGAPRFWSGDRLHANTEGHTRIAAALAHAIHLPGASDNWMNPLPRLSARSPFRLAVEELRWIGSHLIPWLARRATGRSSGDGIRAKRPTLTPMLDEP